MRISIFIAVVVVARLALADEAPQERVRAAREAFVEGAALVKKSQWADALAAFERSAELHPHATTTLNIGGCQRALGRYTFAKLTLERALRESAERSQPLPSHLTSDAEAFIGEIERLLVHVSVTLLPADTSIAIDGRALAVDERSGALIAGLLPPGKGAPPPSSRFEVVLDPGSHVFVLSRAGHSDAVVTRSYAPGARARLDLTLERLPATLRITANIPDAIVAVDGDDVGPAPVDVLRPAGEHRVVVKKKGYVAHHSNVTVKPGEQADYTITLSVEKIPVYKRWWFWTGAGVLAAGIFGLAYGLAYDPPPPQFDRGTTGWLVEPRP